MCKSYFRKRQKQDLGRAQHFGSNLTEEKMIRLQEEIQNWQQKNKVIEIVLNSKAYQMQTFFFVMELFEKYVTL